MRGRSEASSGRFCGGPPGSGPSVAPWFVPWPLAAVPCRFHIPPGAALWSNPGPQVRRATLPRGPPSTNAGSVVGSNQPVGLESDHAEAPDGI